MSTGFWTSIALVLLIVSSAGGQTVTVRQDKNGSLMTYRLIHPLHTVEAVSKEVVYQVQVDPTTRQIKSVSARADVTTFDSGNSNRDSHAMEVIDAMTYPEVFFTSSSITQHGDSLALTGKVTFHGVTKETVIAARSEWSQHRLSVAGEFRLSLTSFNIERPSLFMIVVDDTLSFSFTSVFEWE